MVEAVEKYGCGGSTHDTLSSFGAAVGSADTLEMTRLAHENKPILRNYDKYGNRIDVIEYHPAYHEDHWQVPSFAWNNNDRGSFVTRSALAMLMYQVRTGVIAVTKVLLGAHCNDWRFYVLAQAEPGVSCPLTMTFAAVPALEASPDVAAEWMYDGRNVPISEKKGATMGMSMTEKQGGSDVLSCSGANASKDKHDKLGDHSNASSEVEYDNAWGQMIGEPGRGVATIIEMVVHTRLDCALGSAALMRQVSAVSPSSHYASGVNAFYLPLGFFP
ncbi:aidB [Symbiodinium sp. KB8]|nr:aidB [Symbiodinium sp. KB8]